MKRIIYLLFLSGLLITCCKKDLDPCEAIRNEPGGFKIEEMAFTNKGIEAKDTVQEKCLIRFTSRRTYDSYTWLVGTEAEPRSGKSISVVFPENTNINVKLIGKRAPTSCILGDDGIDTFVQKLITVPWQSSPVLGKWHGYLTSDPSDTFTVEFTLQPEVMDCPMTGKTIMLNLPKNSTPPDPSKVKYCMPNPYLRFNGIEFEYSPISTISHPYGGRQNGYGYFKKNRRELNIEFEVSIRNDSPTSSWHRRHFIGTRVK